MDRALTKSRRNAVTAFRKRLARQGMTRMEVRVRKDDVALVREIVQALASPERRDDARALLRERFPGADGKGLKALLAAAPLQGVDLTRDRDLGRDTKL